MATVQEAIASASRAGFRGTALEIIVAIAWAESGLQTHGPDNINSDQWRSRDRGILQINNHWHPDVSDTCAYDINCAFEAGYRISAHGTNFNAWTTFRNGAYRQYLKKINLTGLSNNNLTKIILPQNGWWKFPRIDNLGQPDPFGGFPKPDTNVQVPDGYPIVNILPGVVTATHGADDAWGASITIRLDTPINNLATHIAYLHLRKDIQVQKGQHINAGTIIGFNGGNQAAGSQKVPLGFALYAGDDYGHGLAWSQMTVQNLTSRLNPVPIIEAAKAGTLTIAGMTSQGAITSGSSSMTQIVGAKLNNLQIPHPFAALEVNASVVAVLVSIDEQMIIVPLYPALSANPLDGFGFPDMISEGMQDFVAYMLRAIFIFMGVYICFKVFANIVDVRGIGQVIENAIKTVATLSFIAA